MRYLYTLIFLLFSSTATAGSWWWTNGGEIVGTSALSVAETWCSLDSNCNEICGLSHQTSPTYLYFKYDDLDSPNDEAHNECTNGNTAYSSKQVRQSTGTCPAALPYEHSDGTCQASQECPAGQFDYGQGCEAICKAGNTEKAWYSCSHGGDHYADAGDGGLCEYTFKSVTTADVGFATDGSAMCNSTYESTGVYIPDTTLAPQNEAPSNNDTDNRQSTTETTAGETTTTDNGDGTSTEQQTTTTTQTQGEGTVIWEENGKVYIQDSSGNVTTTTQETLIERAADNSYTETVTETTTTTTADKQTTVYDNNNGTRTTVSSTGTSSSSQTTTTNTYNSSGIKTSSNSTTSNTGTTGGSTSGECEPQLQDCNGDGDTAAGQPDFIVPTESWWETSYPEGVAGIWAEHSETLDNGSASTWLNSFGLPSSGSLPTWSMSFDFGFINLGTHDLTPPDYVWAAVRIFLLLTAIFLCRRLIFGG